ncbi:DUF2267 domain-containing protein [Actinomycetospora lemnae]|uniref:DUF2267 domain-containing protein n=1 Tax=Actinomycetospora lemnae TaxID=3019891 RepID=A0ABT5SUB2_9PSEU|nr:DUF2267 domain-containing protein [Actinomycetospora sp. DW7H6]MDD7966349.1 DUF2267 domain-containing protein [Actinomycetospora sp. DW7H6]
MQEHEFVSAVKESLGLPDNATAERAVRATLTVLGQRLEGGEAKDLASQLPDGLSDALPSEGGGERFDVDTFYRRIADQEGDDVTVAQARQHARAIAKGLETALSGGEWQNFTSQLPTDYQDFLGTEPVQKH